MAANIVWLGCIYIPLPAKHSLVASHKPSEIRATGRSKLSRDEVFAKIGNPNAYLPDLRIACYQVKSIQKRDLLLVVVVPIGVESEYTGQFDLALIEFDQTDHVKDYEFLKQGNGESFEQVAKRWIELRNKPMRMGKN